MTPAAAMVGVLTPELLDGLVERAGRPDFPASRRSCARRGTARGRSGCGARSRPATGRPPARVVDRGRARRRAAQGVREPPRGGLPPVRGALPPGRLPPDRRRAARRQGRAGHRSPSTRRCSSTLTAPSFGRVHTRALGPDGQPRRCRPRRDAPVCPHGVRLSCGACTPRAIRASVSRCAADCLDYAGAAVVEQHARRAVAPHDDLPPARPRAPRRDDAEAARARSAPPTSRSPSTSDAAWCTCTCSCGWTGRCPSTARDELRPPAPRFTPSCSSSAVRDAVGRGQRPGPRRAGRRPRALGRAARRPPARAPASSAARSPATSPSTRPRAPSRPAGCCTASPPRTSSAPRCASTSAPTCAPRSCSTRSRRPARRRHAPRWPARRRTSRPTGTRPRSRGAPGAR